jgi:hypothetical protein
VSFPEETMLELMSYADGEPLEPAARARVEELLRTNEEARRIVDAMGALGDVVRDGIDGRAAGGEHGAKADAIAESVMAAIATGVAAARSTGDVSAGGKVVTLQGRERRARFVVRGGIAAALALAAGFLLLLSKQGEAPKEIAAVAPALSEARSAERATAALAASAEAKVAGAIAAEEHEVDLEEVRSIENKVNVFFVRAKKGSAAKDEEKTSLVIWIDDRHQGR